MESFCKHLRGLRHKLRMFGTPVESPAYVFGENQSVLSNLSKPHSILKKKSSSIACNFTREGVAKKEWRAICLKAMINTSDVFPKSLPSSEKRIRTGYLLHNIDYFVFIFVME